MRATRCLQVAGAPSGHSDRAEQMPAIGLCDRDTDVVCRLGFTVNLEATDGFLERLIGHRHPLMLTQMVEP